MGELEIQAVGLSDVGRVREKNEDAQLMAPELGLFGVADGMGGHLGGQTASSLAVTTVKAAVEAQTEALDAAAQVQEISESGVPRILAAAIRAACATIYDAAQNNPDLQGMGTTCTLMLVRHGRAFVAHVGDSRCYLQRGEQIFQLTDDHSLVNEQIQAGLLTKDEARTSRLKNIITRSVGFERDVAVDTFAVPVEVGDKFLMCSDGLSSLVDDTEIGLALAGLALDEVPKRMVDLANERGGDDNTTVVCLSVEAAA